MASICKWLAGSDARLPLERPPGHAVPGPGGPLRQCLDEVLPYSHALPWRRVLDIATRPRHPRIGKIIIFIIQARIVG